MLVVIAGPGGVGKDTLARQLCAQDPRFTVSRSWTTRAPRPGEPPDAYTYVDRDVFDQRVAGGGFLEWAEYHGNLYGTPAPDAGDPRHLVLVIETQGARQVLERFSADDVCVILLAPPSPEVLEARLRDRGDDDEAVARRLAASAFEIEQGMTLTEHLVVNDDLTQAVAEVRRILEGRLSGGDAAPRP